MQRLIVPPCAPPGGQVAEELRGRVREQTRVTCSCGVAPNRLLAKIASDINKPDGQFVLPGDTDAVAAFMARLPIRKVPGIGKVTPCPPGFVVWLVSARLPI